MNFKTMLLTTAAVTMIAGVANAKDFTGSLFLPAKGELLSNTSIDHHRLKDKYTGITKALSASEELTYGITDNLSVYGAITNLFEGSKVSSYDFNNGHNFDYDVGVKYNHNFGKVLTQVGLGYNTYQPASWYGHKYWGDDDWSKNINAEVQVGYDMGNGWVPYAMLTATTVVDEHHRPIDYTAFAGVHKTFDKYALDTGVRYEHDHDLDTDQYFWQLEANYFLTDNVALGIHGDYYLGGDDTDGKTKYEWTIGAQLKVLF